MSLYRTMTKVAAVLALATVSLTAQENTERKAPANLCQPDADGNYGPAGELTLSLKPIDEAHMASLDVSGGEPNAAFVLSIGVEAICPGLTHPMIASGAVLVNPLLTIGPAQLCAQGRFHSIVRVPDREGTLYLQAFAFDPTNDGTPVQASRGLRAVFPMSATDAAPSDG